MYGKIGCLASGVVTWTVSECNSFEIGFGFSRDCFDLGPITLPASKSDSLALRFGLSFAENFHHEYPQPNSAYISIFRRVCIQMCSSFSHDFARLASSRCVPSNKRMMKKKKRKETATRWYLRSKRFDLSYYDWYCFHKTRNRPYIFAKDTRSTDKINENVNINSFPALQRAEIRRCLCNGLLAGDISQRY